MNMQPHPLIRSGLLLGLIALLGTALLVFVNAQTRERIVVQEQRRVLQQLNEIVPASAYNNELHRDSIEIVAPVSFRRPAPVTVYRARMDGEPVAVVMRVTATDGYNGDIQLLIGIDAGGTIMGVRVIAHRETPGLGDLIEIEKNPWILGFNGTSLNRPQAQGWAVKKDGGEFDQFTGATISPRAVVQAVHTTLEYFRLHDSDLFAPLPVTLKTHD